MDKVKKLESRLKTALSKKEFYEAHQIMRTLYARMLPSQGDPQKDKQQHRELLKLLCSGCLIMGEAKEFSSAIDLAELFVEALKKTGQKLDSADTMTMLLNIFSNLPAQLEEKPTDSAMDGSGDQQPEDKRTPFLNKTLDWALKSAENRPELLQACVELQRKLADILTAEGRQEQAKRLNQAADWLLGEIDRRSQSTSEQPRTDETAFSSITDFSSISDGPQMDVSEFDLD